MRSHRHETRDQQERRHRCGDQRSQGQPAARPHRDARTLLRTNWPPGWRQRPACGQNMDTNPGGGGPNTAHNRHSRFPSNGRPPPGPHKLYVSMRPDGSKPTDQQDIGARVLSTCLRPTSYSPVTDPYLPFSTGYSPHHPLFQAARAAAAAGPSERRHQLRHR